MTKYEIDISFISIKLFPLPNIGYWIIFFRKYRFIKGFAFRLFGFHFNVRERGAKYKLIKLWKQRYL